jgi:hypothetical protein
MNSKLDRMSQRLKKTKSVVVRLAIEELLRSPGLEGRLSGHDLLGPFVGCIDTGESDLSFNKLHLAGYGK